MRNFKYWALLLVVSWACTSKQYVATDYDYLKPVNTVSREIVTQEKKTFVNSDSDVYADNQFDGARLNNFIKINDTVFRAVIIPENSPINPSPWYAFKIWSADKQTITVQFDYSGFKHRYSPKISKDGEDWDLLEADPISYSEDSLYVQFKLEVSPDTLWVAGQEIVNSTTVHEWCKDLATSQSANFSVVGKSLLGRDLYFLDIYEDKVDDKKTVVIFSRQHPPEVTGYFAMQSFLNEIMSKSALAEAFRKDFRVMVFPLINPDGVDMGHWRHSAGGVDLNRDWAYYRQPEVRQIADFIVKETAMDNNSVVLGLDFHSTHKDVFYTNQNARSVIPEFKSLWLSNLDNAIPNYVLNEKPSEIKLPVSKSWFFTQFQAEGITYEIGDDTPQDFIKLKGKVSAQEMMKILLED